MAKIVTCCGCDTKREFVLWCPECTKNGKAWEQAARLVDDIMDPKKMNAEIIQLAKECRDLEAERDRYKAALKKIIHISLNVEDPHEAATRMGVVAADAASQRSKDQRLGCEYLYSASLPKTCLLEKGHPGKCSFSVNDLNLRTE